MEEIEPSADERVFSIITIDNGYLMDRYFSPPEVMQKLNESRKSCSASCDIIIEVGVERFFCHKAILMECIPLFDAMLKPSSKESGENVITLKNLDAKVFATVLEWVYSGKLKFPLPKDIAGALNLITVCDYLVMTDTLKIILDGFRHYLNSETVCDLCVCLAESGCRSKDLLKMVYNFFLLCFPLICRSKRFHLIPFSVLEKILKNDFVNATKGDIRLAINRWVSYDKPNRLKYVNQLADTVRIPYLYSVSGRGDKRVSYIRTLWTKVCLLIAKKRSNPTKQKVIHGVNVFVESLIDESAYKISYAEITKKIKPPIAGWPIASMCLFEDDWEDDWITAFNPDEVMRKLNDSRKSCSASCDAIIEVSVERFFCHRAILMTVPFFSAIFLSKESGDNVITLTDLDAKAFAAVLESAYVGRLEFPLLEDVGHALNIITVCDHLGLNRTRRDCLFCLNHHIMKLDAPFDVFACCLETARNIEDLSESDYNFILEYFPAVCRSKYFNSMSYNILDKILKDDLVNATEYEILLAINKWVSYDEQNRLKLVNRLIDAVRIPYLCNLSSGIYGRSCINKILLNRVRSLSAQMCNNPAKAEVSDDVNIVAVPPVNKRALKIYFFYSKCSRKNPLFDVTAAVETYVGRWRDAYARMIDVGDNLQDNTYRVVNLRSTFYGLAASPHATSFKYFESYDLTWRSLNVPPTTKTGALNMLSLNNLQQIYLNYTDSLDGVMRYVPARDTWFKGPKYPSSFRKNGCMAADDDNNVIYAFGETNVRKPKSAMLDVRVGKWSKIARMPPVKQFSAATYMDNKVFVTGGTYGSQSYKTGFVYDIRSNVWSNLESMPREICRHLLIAFENSLLAVDEYCISIYSFSSCRWSAPDRFNHTTAKYFSGTVVAAAVD